MTRQKIWTGISVLILAMVFYTNTARAHGKVAMEDDSCMRRIGENMIHLSVYQPSLLHRHTQRRQCHHGD